MKTIFPSSIFETIDSAINLHTIFHSAPDKTKMKAKQICLNLWYFIYNKHKEFINKEELKGEYNTNDVYANIHMDEFHKKENTIYYNKNVYYYSTFINILSDNNILDVNNLYKYGENTKKKFTKSYRIPKFTGKFTWVNVDIDLVFGENFITKKEIIKKYPSHKTLIEDLFKTKIDINKYAKFLLQNHNKTIKKLSQKTIKFKNKKFKILEERILTEDKIMELITDAVKINMGNIWVSVSEEGRFYSSITNLSHLASDFLTYNKEKLYSLDITNCQPLLLNALIDNKELKKATEEGKFYELIQEHMETSRNEVKLSCYKYIFFNNNKVEKGKLMTCINELFPNLVNQINEIKENNKLSSLLQAIEADIIIKGVGSLNIPKVTKHDEVFTTIGYINDVKNFMEKLMKEQYNLNVIIEEKCNKELFN